MPQLGSARNESDLLSDQVDKPDKIKKELPSHTYLAYRPGAKLSQMSKQQRDKSKLMADTTLKIMDNFINDQHFTNYFE